MVDLKNGKEVKLNKTTGSMTEPLSDGRYVTWYRQAPSEVYLYDLKTGTEKMIGTGRNAKIGDGKVFYNNFWYVDAGYVYDANTDTTTKAIELPSAESFSLYAFDGKRLLASKSIRSKDKMAIVLYDLSDLSAVKEQEVLPPYEGRSYPVVALGDTYAAWVRYVDGALQTYVGDLTTGKSWQATSGKVAQKEPMFVGDRLVVMNDDKKLVFKTLTRREVAKTGTTTSTGGSSNVGDKIVSGALDEQVEANIGREGGVLVAKKSGISLQVPEHAWSESTRMALKVKTAWDDAWKANLTKHATPVGPVAQLEWAGSAVKTFKLHFPMDLTKVKPTQVKKLLVHSYDAMQGKWTLVGGTWNEARKEVVVNVDRPGVYGLLLTEITYADIRGHWAQEAIEVAAARQLVQGMSNQEFEPNASLTRAQFVKMLAGALKLPVLLGDQPSFKDVPETHWSYTYVEAAVKAGLVQGDQGRFNPNEKLSREAMTVMLVRAAAWMNGEALKLANVSLLDAYQDRAKVSAWAKPYVASAIEYGLLTGNNQKIEPGQVSTRAQGVVMLLRMLDQIQS